MKPFNETEFRALMLAARKMLWDVSEEKDDREPVSTAMAMALADLEEAACRALKAVQQQGYIIDAYKYLDKNKQPKESHGNANAPADHGTIVLEA